MNEIMEAHSNLPDTIEDLSKFVLVSEVRLKAAREQIRTIRRVNVAKEVYEQKLAEAQEIGQVAVEAAQKMGELLLQIQKQSGANNFSRDNEKLKTKTEITSEMGMSKDQVSQYQQMAQNPDAVQSAIQKAIDNGDVVSRSQVMKEIRAVKEEARRQIAELENRKPEIKEVIKEVAPDDYEELKRKAKMSDAHKSDFQYMQGQYQEMAEKWKKAEYEKDALIAEMNKPEAQEKRELHLSAFHFCMGVASFLEQYGGYAYLMKEIDALDEKERERIMNAVRSIRDWADTMSNEVVTEVIV